MKCLFTLHAFNSTDTINYTVVYYIIIDDKKSNEE